MTQASDVHQFDQKLSSFLETPEAPAPPWETIDMHVISYNIEVQRL